jgi:hypothetical protein
MFDIERENTNFIFIQKHDLWNYSTVEFTAFISVYEMAPTLCEPFYTLDR